MSFRQQMSLTDDQKQAISERYGACNWLILDAAYRLGYKDATMDAACRCRDGGCRNELVLEAMKSPSTD